MASSQEGRKQRKQNISSNTGNTNATKKSGSSTQVEKRPHSDVAESSFGDEFTMIHTQLDQMNSEIKQTGAHVKGMLSKEELKDFIKSTVKDVVQTVMNELENKLEQGLEQKVAEKTAH